MRNRICLAVLVLFALAGSPIEAQMRPGSLLDRKVSVTFHQAPLESVLRTLRRQYGIRISYSNTALNLRQPITLDMRNQPLRTVLNTLLADKNIGYELVDDQVVLHPARPSKPRAAPAAAPTTGSKAASNGLLTEPATPSPPSAKPAVGAGSPTDKTTAPLPAKRPPTQPAPARKPAPQEPTGSVGSPSKSGMQSAEPASATTGQPTSRTPVGPKATTTTAATPPQPAAQEALGTPKSLESKLEKLEAELEKTGAELERKTTAELEKVEAELEKVEADVEELMHTVTKKAQVSFLGPLGSNGFRNGQMVNQVSVNVLGGYSAGVDGFEAAGLFNVTRDSVRGVQVAGLANVVGRHLAGFQGAGLLNVLGGTGTGWQAAGLLNVAARPVNGVQTAGLFNYAGPTKPAAGPETTDATPAPRRATVQAAGLFNVALSEVRGVQAAGLFNVAGTVHGVQVAGLFNVADSVDGVSLAPFNFVRHGYHRFEVVHTETWPVEANFKLGGSAGFYTFLAGTYAGTGPANRRWAVGYGLGAEVLARRRLSLSLDAVALHVNEQPRGWTDDLNLHNQFRLLVGLAPLRADGHWRLVAGPTVSVLVTQRYAAERGQVHSRLGENRTLWLNEGNALTRVLGWMGYCVGMRF